MPLRLQLAPFEADTTFGQASLVFFQRVENITVSLSAALTETRIRWARIRGKGCAGLAHRQTRRVTFFLCRQTLECTATSAYPHAVDDAIALIGPVGFRSPRELKRSQG